MRPGSHQPFAAGNAQNADKFAGNLDTGLAKDELLIRIWGESTGKFNSFHSSLLQYAMSGTLV